jgi:hypothetical protein
MPYKIWSVNEILTAADMNTYIGNQTVLSFAGTAARSSAIGTPVDGMLSYVGGGTVEVYVGGTVAAWTAVSGGGGSGNVADDTIQPNFNTISNNYTFPDNYNGVSAGPITIASGATVTVGTASAWSIV